MHSKITIFSALSFASFCLCFVAAAPLAAQHDGVHGPPKVLVIQREYLKPGKAGSTHDKSEAAFVKAMADAHYPTSYFAMDSLSGPPRSLFFIGYPSFAAWEEDNARMRKNRTLQAAMDHATLMDGDLLSSADSSVLNLREDFTLASEGGLTNMRYMEISLFVVKPGHQRDWNELVKMYLDGYKKAVTDAHWVTFELVYGTPNAMGGNTFLVVTPLKSLSETDKGFGDSEKFAATMGPGAMKRLGELTEACISSSTTNLFEINPRSSYPPEEWVKAEPDFWKPKPAPVVKKASVEAKQ